MLKVIATVTVSTFSSVITSYIAKQASLDE